MSENAKETEGGIFIRVDTDKRGKDHVDIYDNDPREEHSESIHITLNEDGSGTITTKSDDNPRETTDTQCFLTTACMRQFKNEFDDNCYELSILRWFRDNFVTSDDINHYYDVAPKIVKEINKDDKSNLVYRYIFDNVICCCIDAIENGDYEEAYNKYKECILNLENYYSISFQKERSMQLKLK